MMLSGLEGLLLLLAIVLPLAYQRLFSRAVIALVRVPLVYLIIPIARLGYGLITKTAKSLIALALFLLTLALFLLTSIVGRFAIVNVEKESRRLVSEEDLYDIRQDLVGIAAEKPEDEIEDLEVQLESLRESEKRRYQNGEFLFSATISVGVLFGYFVPTLLGVTIPLKYPAWALEGALLLISGTMAFRTAVLEVLAYHPEEATSIENPETALSWQKMVCQGPAFIQALILIMGVTKQYTSDVVYETAHPVIRRMHYENLGRLETMEVIYEEWRKNI